MGTLDASGRSSARRCAIAGDHPRRLGLALQKEPETRTAGATAEVILHLLMKHIRDGSFEELPRQVRASPGDFRPRAGASNCGGARGSVCRSSGPFHAN